MAGDDVHERIYETSRICGVAQHIRVAAIKETSAMFSPPRTPLELLHNLKTAFDLDLVSKDEFYSDDNLKAFSGARIVGRVDGNPDKVSVSIAPEGLVRPIPELGHPGVQYRIVKETSASDKVSVHAHLSFVENQPGLNFENLEAIFGRDWADYPIIPRPPTWTPLPPSHPRGNGRIRYHFSNNKISRKIIIYLFEDGSFSHCSISQETK